jgi:hypothetical protein
MKITVDLSVVIFIGSTKLNIADSTWASLRHSVAVDTVCSDRPWACSLIVDDGGFFGICPFYVSGSASSVSQSAAAVFFKRGDPPSSKS